MVDTASVKAFTAAVQEATEAYAQDDSVLNYKQLQMAVRRLQVAATTPADTLFTFRLQVVGNIAIVMLIELGVLDALVAINSDKVGAGELAASTGCNAELIERLMRVVCGLGFCEEVGEQAYRPNEVTRNLVQPGWKGALRWMDIIYPIAGKIREYLSVTGFGRKEEGALPTPFEYTHGMPMWKVLEEQPDQRLNFDMWMRERRKHEETSWHRRFPPSASLTPQDLKSEADAVLMVDVGGAHGSQLVNFRTQFAHLHLPGRFVLQDLPESVAAMKQPEGVEVMAYDFFTQQPIKGARFYYFRSVFHNWPDEKCIEILRNVVPAMEPGYSTLLIDDYVLPTTDAQLRSAIADIHMMAMFNSSERTAKQYEQLLAEVGLEIVTVFPAGANEEAIIEARVKTQ